MNEAVLQAVAADALDMDAERARLQGCVEAMLDEARKLGASAAEVAVSIDVGLSVEVRQGEVETVEFNRDGGLGVTVYFGQRKGNASTGDTSPAALRQAVQAACAIARHTAEDPYAGLADPARLARDWPDLDLDHPLGLLPEQAIAMALECEAAGLNVDPRVRKSGGVSVSSHRGLRYYANSLGFVGGVPSTRHSISATLVAEDAQGMQRDYWYTVARDGRDLHSPESVGRRAAERAARRLGARPIATGNLPVILVPETARGFFGHLLSAVKGGALYRRASYLCDRLHTPVMAAHLSLREEPLVAKGLGSAAFDDEGVATYAHDIVRDGVLDSYILGSYSARRLGLESTGNAGGVHNIRVDSSRARPDFDQLLREMGEGLVITSLMGQGVNTITGDYSRGASGFYVRNGVIEHPVEEITIAGHLQELYDGIRCVGSDVEMQSALWTGSVLIDGFTVAGAGEEN